MTAPDYEAELNLARSLADAAIEGIDFLTVVETIPVTASEEAAVRVHGLLSTFTADTTAQTVRAYLTNGETR